MTYNDEDVQELQQEVTHLRDFVLLVSRLLDRIAPGLVSYEAWLAVQKDQDKQRERLKR